MIWTIERAEGLIFITSDAGHFAVVDTVEKMQRVLAKWMA